MAPVGPRKPAERGERFDDASGLQYLNARYYDPKLAMFVQPDWWEVMQQGVGTNRYSYSFNDPVNGKDPGGNLTYDTRDDDFKADDGDTLSSAADSLGLKVDDLVAANNGLDAESPLEVGTSITVPRSARIRAGTAAAKLMGVETYALNAEYDANFGAGVNKCNIFVSDMLKIGFNSSPSYVRQSYTGILKAGVVARAGNVPLARELSKTVETPALAGDWYDGSMPGMEALPPDQAKFGDVAASRSLTNRLSGGLLGASGHSTISMGDVNIVDGTGQRWEPNGGFGTVGASSDMVRYRDAAFLESRGYNMSFTRWHGQ